MVRAASSYRRSTPRSAASTVTTKNGRLTKVAARTAAVVVYGELHVEPAVEPLAHQPSAAERHEQRHAPDHRRHAPSGA